MRSNKISAENLRHYIENYDVVYQTFGGLIEVANDENIDERNALLDYFEKASSIEIYSKGDVFVQEPFEDLSNWSTNSDVLFLLQPIGVLMCIPKKYADENKLIAIE